MLKQNQLGFYEIVDKPSREELSDYYQQKYYQEGRGSYELKYTQQELDYFNAKNQRLHHLIDLYHHPSSDPTLLDIGCGEGFALSYFARHNFLASGLDFSQAGVKQQNPELLPFIEFGDLFSLIEEKINLSSYYDVILLQNVLEHVLDPIQLLSSIHKLLNKDGLALITVPNDFSPTHKKLLSEGCIDHEFWVCPPDHLSYFNYESLQNILLDAGFNVRDIISDFPVDWYLFHPASNYIQDSSNGKDAHKSRVLIENMLHENSIANVVSLYRSLAKVGGGRNLTAVVSRY